MSRVVVDTGPLVALLNRSDRHHDWVRQVLDTVEPPVFTCEAVISEACFLLSRIREGQDAVLELLSKDILKVDFRLSSEIDSVRALMKKFRSVPMSFADACLVRISELEPRSRILTLDSDFRVYRRNRRQTIPTVMPGREGGG
jgi:predicted nucleic acid-binding protein